MGFQNQPKTILLISLLLTISLFTLKPALAELNDEDFIKKSCKETQYPDLCYTSLSPFASQVKNSSEKLAAVSINLCLSKVQPLKEHAQDLAKKAKKPPILKSALGQCVENFGDAIVYIKKSIKQMKDPKAPGAKGNLQYWMTAAISFEGSCEIGMTEVPDGPAEKTDMLNQTHEVMHITSISLHMIEIFARS